MYALNLFKQLPLYMGHNATSTPWWYK